MQIIVIYHKFIRRLTYKKGIKKRKQSDQTDNALDNEVQIKDSI
jgi:hypothetical protein